MAARGKEPRDPVRALSRLGARTRHLAGGLEKRCDPLIAIGGVGRARGDGAVAHLFATGTGEAQAGLAPIGEEVGQLGDLSIGCFEQLDRAFAHFGCSVGAGADEAGEVQDH
jgi:hypothetical protein